MAGGGGGDLAGNFTLPFPMTDPAQQYQYLNQQGTLGAMSAQAGTGAGPSTGEALQIGAAGQGAATTAANTAIQEDQLGSQVNELNAQQNLLNQESGLSSGIGGLGK